MKFLILGLSSIAQRRVIPALTAISGVEGFDIASQTKAIDKQMPKLGEVYSDYQVALNHSDAAIAYVSLPNSAHQQWVLAALAADKHVIVDKPATLTLQSAEECLNLASGRRKLLAEATVFASHPHIAAITDFFIKYGPLTHIDAQFIIPPLPTTNFRMSRSLGGGCLADMGPYAAALARLFGTELESISVIGAPQGTSMDVDVGFTLAAQFVGGMRYTGHFSFESEYQNRLIAVGKKGSIMVERIFSPPAEDEVIWQTRSNNSSFERRHPPADVFKLFLEEAMVAINAGAHDRFLRDLLCDVRFRSELSTPSSRQISP